MSADCLIQRDSQRMNTIPSLKDIIQPIFEADVVIADLTGLNANVLYELGIAHSFNKKTIVITQDEVSELPFDLKLYRAKGYSTHFKKFAELIEYLRINLKGAISGSVQYSNPVKDFLSMEKIEATNWFEDKIAIDLANDSEGGFIDFLAEIEADTEKMVAEITQRQHRTIPPRQASGAHRDIIPLY